VGIIYPETSSSSWKYQGTPTHRVSTPSIEDAEHGSISYGELRWIQGTASGRAPQQHAAVFCIDEKTANSGARSARSGIAAVARVRRTARFRVLPPQLWFAKIQRDVIERGVFASVPDLARKLQRYIRPYEKSARPFRWTYTDPQRRIRTDQITGTAH
jgi:hypothetical protein